MHVSEWILGLDIGGTKTAAIVGDSTGRVRQRVVFASQPERGFAAMWQQIVATGQQLIAAHGPPQAIGVSIGGPLDSQRGIIYSPPNLPGWDAVPLKQLLEEALGVPAFVEHDARACALAEWLFGAAQGYSDIVFLTFGTGLGAGLILGGKLIRGATGVAGEVGHWRIAEDGPLVYGKAGSWEGYSSGAGIAALARIRFPASFPAGISAGQVVERARAGDSQSHAVIVESAQALGRGIALLIDLLNPQVVVLGSIAVRAGDLFLPIVRAVVDQEALAASAAACLIVPAGLGDQIGDMATLCAALYQIERQA